MLCSSNLAISSTFTCIFSAKSLHVPIYILKNSLVLSVTPSNSGTISDISPQYLSKNFTFTFSSSSISQPVVMHSNFGDSGFLFYVTDVPDATSIFECNSTYAHVGSIISCISIFKRNNELVYNTYSKVSCAIFPSSTLSLIPTSYTNSDFNYNFTSNFISTSSNGVVSTISDSIASSDIQIYIYGLIIILCMRFIYLDTPDSTSVLNCTFSKILVSQNLSCSAVCKKSDSPIFCSSLNFEPIQGYPSSFITSTLVNGSNFHIFNPIFIDSIFNFYFISFNSYLYTINLPTSGSHFSIIAYGMCLVSFFN